jgi:hypothetical protein
VARHVFQACPVWIYTQSNITQASYSPEYITPTQQISYSNFFAPILLLISSHFSTRGSQVRCELANYVSKFGNWARTSQQSSQVHFSV